MLDVATVTLGLVTSLSIGTLAGASLRGGRIEGLKAVIADNEATIANRDETISDLTGDLKAADNRNTELAAELTVAERKLGRAQAEIVELKPLAEHGRRNKASRDRQNATRKAARAQDRAAKASNVTSIAQPKRQRRSRAKPI